MIYFTKLRVLNIISFKYSGVDSSYKFSSSSDVLSGIYIDQYTEAQP